MDIVQKLEEEERDLLLLVEETLRDESIDFSESECEMQEKRVSEEFRREFEEWEERAGAWFQKKLQEGYSLEQVLEMFWGKDLLQRLKKL